MLLRKTPIKINHALGLLTVVVFLVSVLILNFFLRRDLQQEAMADAKWVATIILHRNLATHAYFTKELNPRLLKQFQQTGLPTSDTHPEWMSPSHAIGKFDTYSRDHIETNYYYKEFSLKARNPQNEADPYERQFIEKLNKNPDLEQDWSTRTIDGVPYFVLMHRGDTTDLSKPGGHGAPANGATDVPAANGSNQAAHLQSGRVVSAVSLRIPIATELDRMAELSQTHSGRMLTILLGVCLAQWFAYRYFIVTPLHRVRDKASQIAGDDRHLGEQLKGSYLAEMAEVAESFNIMSAHLWDNRNNLELQIQKRTIALAGTNQRLNDLIAAAPLPIIASTTKGIVTEWNPAAETVFGWEKEEVLGTLNPIVPKSKRVEYKTLHAKLLDGQIHSREILCRQKKDGSLIDVSLSTSPLRDDENKIIGVIGILEDITARKQASQKLSEYQHRLRALSAELSLIEERERRLIASDLHDNLGQTLALAKIKLQSLRGLLPSETTSHLFQEINKLLAESIGYTRSLTSKVSPQILYTLPFTAAVEWLAERLLLNNNIQVEVIDDGQPKPLGEDARVLLFKTLRELLMNIVKHAQATSAVISLQRENNHLLIEINDNGIGFDVNRQKNRDTTPQGYGLFSIRERLTYLGGELAIISPPSQGAHISIMIPLKETT